MSRLARAMGFSQMSSAPTIGITIRSAVPEVQPAC
jgi:hypothetical protein